MKFLEPLAVRVEDPERGVPGARQLAGDLEQLLQDSLEFELGDEGAADGHEPSQDVLIEVAADLNRALALHWYGM